MSSSPVASEFAGEKDFADPVTSIELPQGLNSTTGREVGRTAEGIRNALWGVIKAQKANEIMMENKTQGTPDITTGKCDIDNSGESGPDDIARTGTRVNRGWYDRGEETRGDWASCLAI